MILSATESHGQGQAGDLIVRVLSTWMASKTSESQDDSVRRTHSYRILRDAALARGETRAKDPEKNRMS